MVVNKPISITKSTQADIPRIAALLGAESSAALRSRLQEVIRDGLSVIAKTDSGEVVGHGYVFNGKDGEALYVAVSDKSPSVLRNDIEGALRKILRPEQEEFRDYVPLPGTCDK
jgi:hypothetical protein